MGVCSMSAALDSDCNDLLLHRKNMMARHGSGNPCVSLSRSVKLEDSLRDDDAILRRQ
jgi:hypothetical protein